MASGRRRPKKRRRSNKRRENRAKRNGKNEENVLSCGKEAQKFVQSAKNNKIQAERIMNMMKEFYA